MRMGIPKNIVVDRCVFSLPNTKSFFAAFKKVCRGTSPSFGTAFPSTEDAI